MESLKNKETNKNQPHGDREQIGCLWWRIGECEKWVKEIKRYKLPVIK